MRSWHGLPNQIGCFHSDHTIMEPLKSLLSLKEVFKWTQEASAAFKTSKQKILEVVEKGIRTF